MSEDYFSPREYRDNLAKELLNLPKDLRREALDSAKSRNDYLDAFFGHRQEQGLYREEQKEIKSIPDLDFDLDNEEEFRIKIESIAQAIFSMKRFDHRIKNSGDKRKYDPYKGDMLCGDITNQFIDYFEKKGIKADRISRNYDILAPDGTFSSVFGHVYFIIERDESKILIDPTYLQWIKLEEREKLPPVLIIRYKDFEELRGKIKSLPIANPGMVLPFYLGFNSEEAREFFKDTKFTSLSDNRGVINE